MRVCNLNVSVGKIETFGLVDGPGIRTVVFLNGCSLRCKYCHNPEMWTINDYNMSEEELIKRILRNKPYYKRNNGGVTFSGGEPLVQSEFLLSICQKLKAEDIHIALDTCGSNLKNAKEILDLVDLILLDIKHTDSDMYLDITGSSIDTSEEFIQILNEAGKEVWIRQVIIPGINDNIEYMEKLNRYLKKVKNITRIDFLPFHTMGFEKYDKLNIENPYKNIPAMDKEKCNELYQTFLKIDKKESR